MYAKLTNKVYKAPQYENCYCDAYIVVTNSDNVIYAKACINNNGKAIAKLKVVAPEQDIYIESEGTASGTGYDKKVAAFFDAVNRAGIRFYEDEDKKKEIVIRGGGQKLIKEALEAIANELGYASAEVATIRGI